MRALICGVSGQDGAYLAKSLVEKGYEVIGTSRDATVASFYNLRVLGVLDKIEIASMATNDFRSVLFTLKRYLPDEVYNLAGQSSVGLSFEQPAETIDSILGATLNLLEAIRFIDHPIRFYNAGSSECFGDTGDAAASENTSFSPKSPYAVAKSSAYWLVKNYRTAYGLFACTGILFNHESPLRPDRFVTQKIVKSACRIHNGSHEKLNLGNIAIQRDWGWAPDYVEAMWQMLSVTSPDDYVIGTGRTESLEYFIERVFLFFNLDWRDHVFIDKRLFRVTDIMMGRSDPQKARSALNWCHSVDIDGVVERMCLHASKNSSLFI